MELTVDINVYLLCRVSIDKHDLTMISSDGYRFENTEVQSFIISPGERFDFIINATQTPDCYCIRAETLEVLSNGKKHSAEAVLRYNESSSVTDQVCL